MGETGPVKWLTRGLPTSIGLDRLAHFIPTEDADAVRAIKDAGALVFGKNNLVEMSYGLTGHNERYGQVKNPRAHGSRHGRVIKRFRRIRGRRDSARLLGWRYSRIDPCARVALWCRRVQADHRTLAA
ncbi:amidase family protein [Cupriavidus necator]|uniref:amidase family protein n=1 Tax=Cupriavidus necator TaxID=106590 RepID=UPI003ED0802B